MEYTSIKTQLKKLSKTKTFISLSDLAKLSKITEHSDAVEMVNNLIKENIITPVESSKNTFKQPVIKEKYRLCKENQDYSQYINELNFTLHYSLDTQYYKQYLDQYILDRDKILKLSSYLTSNADDIQGIKLAINERSLLIFNDEKELLTADCKAILNRLGLRLDDLGIYYTPEPFFYYCNNKIKSDNVLIIENKDTWYTIRELIREGKPVLGVFFKAVIYGEGNKISSSFKDISYPDYNDFNSIHNKFYYFGDIDRGGVSIFLNLLKVSGDYSIIPFNTAYRILLQNMQYSRVKTYKKAEKINKEEVYNAFNTLDRHEIDKILNLCSEKMILPQEIINNKILREYK